MSKVKGVNQQVLERIEEKNKKKDQAKADKKFQTLPSVLPLKELPSVEPGFDNLDIDCLKQNDREVLRSYDFKVTPAALLSGIIIVYPDKKVDLILYMYKGSLYDPENLETVHRLNMLNESPLGISEEVLKKAPDNDSLSVFYRIRKNASYQEIFKILFDYYKWVYNTFIASTEEEKEPDNKLTIDLKKFDEVDKYLT